MIVMIPPLDYLSEAENKQRDQIISDLNSAFLQRSQSYTELDDMTYDQWYVANKKAATGYIRPKVNKQDIRTVTGTTREKCNTITTALLRFNYDFALEAYDEENWPEHDLAEGVAGLVRKSQELEEPTYKEKLALFINEFVAQGNVFLFERNVQEEILRKKMKNDNFGDEFHARWEESKQMINRCEIDMIPGLNVYLGDIRQYYMDKQPFIGVRREIHKSKSEQIYGYTKRWKQAKEHKNTHVLNDKGGQEYNNWYMITPSDQFQEEVLYFNLPDNTFQILLDGVPMLPEGFPLEYLTGALKYPVIKGNGESISRYFAYCRGISSKNKFNQAMIDEMFKIIMLKFRLSTNPPMSNMTGKVLNKSIFYPATIHQGVDVEKLKPIGPTNGINGSEFDMFKLVKAAVDEASVSPLLEGNRTPGQQTAKEISELKSQSLQKLGMIMVGWIQCVEQMTWLRVWNILKNWTALIDKRLDPVKKQIKEEYRSESINQEFSDGSKGLHIVRMMKGNLPGAHQTLAEESLLQKRKGVNVRITNLNVDELASLKYKFYVTVTPTEKDHSDLKGALFEESMLKAKQIWPTAVNDQYVQGQWATYKGLDPKKLFIQNAPAPAGGLPGGFLMPGMPSPGNSPGGPNNIPAPRGQQAGAQTPPGSKTVGAQLLPQAKQQMKPQLRAMA